MYLSLDYGSDNCDSIVMTVQVFPQSTLEAMRCLRWLVKVKDKGLIQALFQRAFS